MLPIKALHALDILQYAYHSPTQFTVLEMAESLGQETSVLSSTMSILVRLGYFDTVRGCKGGYTLRVEQLERTLAQFLIDFRMSFAPRLCEGYKLSERVQREFEQVAEGHTLLELMEEPNDFAGSSSLEETAKEGELDGVLSGDTGDTALTR